MSRFILPLCYIVSKSDVVVCVCIALEGHSEFHNIRTLNTSL